LTINLTPAGRFCGRWLLTFFQVEYYTPKAKVFIESRGYKKP
jgi:hypothetical protein